MVEYSITIRKNKKLRSEAECLQTCLSFFEILKNLPEKEYVRYTEGFLFSLRESNVSLSLLASTILGSPSLKFRFHKSFSTIDQEGLLYVLDRMQKMWPREKEVVSRLKSIVEASSRKNIKQSNWIQGLSIDFLNYILTGKKTEMYIENVSKRSISHQRLDNILNFTFKDHFLHS